MGLEKVYLQIQLLMFFFNSILQSHDHKHLVRGLFCDLQKAFDCVNHHIIIIGIQPLGRFGQRPELSQ